MPKLSIGIVSLLLLFSCVGGVETSDAENQLEMSGNAGDNVIATGDFEGFGHIGEGSAILIEDESGDSLSLEDFRTTPGPDLRVYLSTDLDAGDFIDLGELMEPEGNQSYAIEDPVDTSVYKYALIWFKTFSVLFAAAELE